MRTISRVVNVKSGSDKFRLYGLGDTHGGHSNVRYDLMRDDVARIAADPNALWWHLGDVADAIFPGDKRFKMGEVDVRYRDDLENMNRNVVEDLADIYRPIAEKCVGIHTGNHDDTGASRTYYHAPSALADRLKVPYLGAHCLARLSFKRGSHVTTVVVHTMHGSGGGALAGAPANYLEKQMANVEAHVHMMGHLHRKGIVRKPMVTVASSGALRLVKRTRIGVACGSYMESYREDLEDYGEAKGMPAWDMGMVGVEVHPESMRFEVLA